jgi:colanic acid/amylovoran biosynthesis glycosyltransferase
MEALIRDLELRDAVTLLGRRSRESFIEELDRAHIYIQPSRTAADGDSEGGAPTTLLEAQACGLPIIATRHADIPQIVREGDSAMLCDEADVGALAACISVLASSPQRWPSMGRSGRAHVEARHDVRRLATKLEILYATLAETGRLDAVGQEG